MSRGEGSVDYSKSAPSSPSHHHYHQPSLSKLTPALLLTASTSSSPSSSSTGHEGLREARRSFSGSIPFIRHLFPPPDIRTGNNLGRETGGSSSLLSSSLPEKQHEIPFERQSNAMSSDAAHTMLHSRRHSIDVASLARIASISSGSMHRFSGSTAFTQSQPSSAASMVDDSDSSQSSGSESDLTSPLDNKKTIIEAFARGSPWAI